MTTTDILYEKRDHVALATLNRPERLNALRAATLRELLAILDDARADDAVRVLVLTGRGRAFCAGEDLKELDSQLGASLAADAARQHLEELQELTRRLVGHPKIILAAVNGIAVGLGVELAIACDIRLASTNASFAFSEVRRGLFETNGVLWLLPRLVGEGRALDWWLSGETISAGEALAAGLVTRLAAPPDLLDTALELARTIASNAPIPVQRLKRALHQSYAGELEAMLAREVEACLACLESEDLREGLRAFAEKRAPAYKGR